MNHIVINDIDTAELDLKYGLSSVSNIRGSKPANTTDIGSIIDIDKEFSSFLDDPHKQYRLRITMIDGATSQDILSSGRDIACFWCRHRFASQPIGCPLRYVPNQVEKTLRTRANEKYVIRENIAVSEMTPEMTSARTHYYETDGVFCSFNCCAAFIDDNHNNSRYRFSRSLMMNMYCAINDVDPSSLPDRVKPAPSWRLLREYGGHLSIDEFRGSLNRIEFTETHVLNNVPRSRPVAVMYEEKQFL